MKIATWNVNSLRVRLPHVLDWLGRHRPDVLCLQETKLVDADFPVAEIRDSGYHVVYSGQKTYNGVATLSRTAALDTVAGMPGDDDPQRRVLAATVDNVRVINVYIPNGQQVGTEKYEYKLAWLSRLQAYVQSELACHRNAVLLGDFNIAPEDRDVHEPELWTGKVLCSEPERAAFRALVAVGLGDSFRKFDQEPGIFSWWDYRAAAFRRKRGLRIDHILCSAPLYEKCLACSVDTEPRKLERPSDHAPVVAEFEGF
jgi:exodeoxyribonuclease-3